MEANANAVLTVEAVRKQVRAARRKHKWTQPDLAKMLGVRGNTYACWENGIRPFPLIRLVEACLILGARLGDILNTAEDSVNGDAHRNDPIDTLCARIDTLLSAMESEPRVQERYAMTTKDQSPTRLAVNITPVTRAIIGAVLDREGVTQTEAVRRLIQYGDFVYQVIQVDGDEFYIRRGGNLERIVMI